MKEEKTTITEKVVIIIIVLIMIVCVIYKLGQGNYEEGRTIRQNMENQGYAYGYYCEDLPSEITDLTGEERLKAFRKWVKKTKNKNIQIVYIGDWNAKKAGWCQKKPAETHSYTKEDFNDSRSFIDR